jgi:hypothetical protein
MTYTIDALRTNAEEADPAGIGYDRFGTLLPPHGHDMMITRDGDFYVVESGSTLEYTSCGDLIERRPSGGYDFARRWDP